MYDPTEVRTHIETMTNLPGVVFDATKKTTIYSEDIKSLNDRIATIENTPPPAPSGGDYTLKSYRLLAADAILTEFEVMGLDLTTDKHYKIIGMVKVSGAAIKFGVNLSNGGNTFPFTGGRMVSGMLEARPNVSNEQVATAGGCLTFEGTLMKYNDDSPATFIFSSADSTNSRVHWGYCKYNFNTNITSLGVTHIVTQPTTLAGSFIAAYKLSKP